jgi:hypothetical protein
MMNVGKMNRDLRIARMKQIPYQSRTDSSRLIDEIEKIEKGLTPDDWSNPYSIGQRILRNPGYPSMNVIPSDSKRACQPTLLVIFNDKCCDFPSRLLEAAIHCIKCKNTKEVILWTPVWNSLVWGRYRGHFKGMMISVRLVGIGILNPSPHPAITAPTPSGWEPIDKTLQYQNTKPTAFRFQRYNLKVESWTQLLMELFCILHKLDGSTFKELTAKGANPLTRGSYVLISNNEAILKQPMKINGLPFFMETKFKANDFVRSISDLLTRFGFCDGDLLITRRES